MQSGATLYNSKASFDYRSAALAFGFCLNPRESRRRWVSLLACGHYWGDSLVEKGPPSITEAAEESSGFPPCSMEVLAQSDIVELGKSFRIFLACLHSLEQDLCQTAHLFQLFPLHPSSGESDCGVSHLLRKNVCDERQ